MSRILHLGMIHPMSEVYKAIGDFRPGDAIYWYESPDRVDVGHVVNAVPVSRDYTRLTIAYGDFATCTTQFNASMLRVPPTNPRYNKE